VVKRPNILLVLADQLTASALPFHGGVADAPALQRLADGGVVFTNAYCASPLCAPSRAALLTGRLPSKLGVYDNAAELPASAPTIAHHLRSRGYATSLAGKMHFIGPDQLHGFEERLTTDVYPAGFDWVPDWSLPLDERLPWYHDMSSVHDAGVSEATLQLDFDEEVGFRAERKLFDLARSRERPFFLTVSFTHPHDPYESRQRYWDRYDGRAIPDPRVPPLPREEQDAHSRRLAQMYGLDDAEPTPSQVAHARRAYHASVSYVDDKVDALLSTLAETGLARDTIVIVTSDHGDMLGERGLWYKMSFFEDSVRVPLIVHAPWAFEARRIAAGVSLLDLLPTVLELAAGEPAHAPGLDGTSLAPFLRGEPPGARTILAEYLAEGTHAPCVMVRDGSLKLIHCPTDPDLLYDLSADPLELTDASATCEPELQRLRETVAREWDLVALGDAIRTSQQERLLIGRAVDEGAATSWDYSPPDQSAGRYVRGRDFWRPFAAARLRPPNA